jgi:hypothetical protein
VKTHTISSPDFSIEVNETESSFRIAGVEVRKLMLGRMSSDGKNDFPMFVEFLAATWEWARRQRPNEIIDDVDRTFDYAIQKSRNVLNALDIKMPGAHHKFVVALSAYRRKPPEQPKEKT